MPTVRVASGAQEPRSLSSYKVLSYSEFLGAYFWAIFRRLKGRGAIFAAGL
jgi:hypothetical protein